MLYKPGVVDTKEIDFLFDVDIYNEDIDLREVAAIQGFYEKNGYIPDQHIVTFLNWLTYSARKNVSNELEDITKSSFAGRCAVAQSFFVQMLDKLGLKKMTFNVGDVLGTEPIHALTCVEVPTKINGEDVTRTFMLDPTFRQFCITEENRYERYNEEARWGVRMSTPHPGYFFNLTDEGKEFASGLIHYGFFEINEDSLKTYFDPFALYVTPKESYQDSSLVGRVASTDANGYYYWERMVESRKKPNVGYHNFDLRTPREVALKEDNKLINRIRGRNIQGELDRMFEEQYSGIQTVNENTSKK